MKAHLKGMSEFFEAKKEDSPKETNEATESEREEAA